MHLRAQLVFAALGCIVFVSGCSGAPAASSGGTAAEPAHAETPAQARPTSSASTLCLPLVSGCGCAYVCAQSLRQLDATRHDVVHDLLDSRTDEAVVERRCFDAAGHAYPEGGAPPEATNCRAVFYDLTPCGGECIPSTEYLDCHVIEGRCRP
ncbi:MAG: hypothetical protein ACK5U8_22600 [Deltaproteobacteria bacterium]|jgi:hypothetical protein